MSANKRKAPLFRAKARAIGSFFVTVKGCVASAHERIRMTKILCSKKSQKIIANQRRFSFFLSVLLLLTLLLSSCAPADPAEAKERLENRIENANVQFCATVTDCLQKWKFPKGYDAKKLLEVEKTLYKNFYQELSPIDMAKEAASCFLRLFYDFISFDDEKLYTDALIHCLVMALDDDYAIYRTAEEYAAYQNAMSGTFGGIGITVNKNKETGIMRITRIIADSPAERAGIRIGDILHSVEGIEVTKENMNDTFSQLAGDVGTTANFEVRRGDEIIPFSIMRENLENMTVAYTLSEDKIAYISVSSFKRSTYNYFKKAIDAATEAGAIGFIFDVRNNPGGYINSALNVLDCLVPEETELCSYGTKKSIKTIYVASQPDKISVPCVVICNGATASAGELFTAAIRDYNDMGILKAAIIGTEASTFGKGIMQNTYHLSDESVLTMTTAFYNPPCRQNYHGTGVIPDLLCAEETAIETAQQALLDLIQNN